MRLFQFELKKIVFSKRFLYIMAFVILCIGALFLRNHIFQATIQQEREEYILSAMREGQKNISQLELTIENNPKDEVAKEKIIRMEEIINTLFDMRKAFHASDWQQELRIENLFLAQLQDYKAMGGEFSYLSEDIKRTLAYNTKHIATNIAPEHETYSTALPNFMKQIIDIIVNFGIIAVVLILVGDSLTTEFEQRSIQFLYTQPLKKSAIIRSKFWSAVIIYGVVTLCSLVTAWGVALLFGKQGTFLYPILIEENGIFSFMTITEYGIAALTSVTVIILFVISLCLIVSLLFKNTIVSLLTVLILLIGGYALFAQLSFSNIEWLNPFEYVLAKETIHKVGYDWYKGIGVTLTAAFLCYIISLLRIRFVRTM